MSKSDNTFLHLPLDEIRNRVAVNVGGMGGDATVMGNPQIRHDPELGSCMQFDGVDDYLDLRGLEGLDLKEGLTIAVWVRFKDLQRYSRILDINNQNNNSKNGIFLNNHGTSNQLTLEVNQQPIYTDNAIKLDTWQHFAITVHPKGLNKILLDGQKVKEEIKPFFPNMKTGWTTFFIGKSSSTSDAFFKGAMANFRLYDYPLEEQDIANLMKKDKTNMAVYRETAPLKMELYSIRDDNHLPVIFIESANKSEPLELSVTNPTDKPILFKAIENPTVNDFHFQFRFRKNVVAPNVLDALRSAANKTIDDWQYSLIGPADGGKEDWISFVRKGGADFNLPKGESITLQLPTFSAAAQGGARNTRVEVRYQIKDLPTGSIIRHLEIQSHLGLKTVPLIAQVKGSNSILNDGKAANELTIEVLFTKAVGSVLLNPDTSKPSRFELVVEEDLFTPNSLSATTTTNGFDTQPAGDGQGHKTFPFDVQNAVSLSKDNKLVINLSNWITNAETGIHNLLLRYENIPGYWDGAWVLPVKMGPIVIRENNVGIGTDVPTAKLQVEGDLNVGGKGNGRVKARHIDGKDYMSDAYDKLYLNYDTGKDVEVGGVKNADLIVHGRIKDQTGFIMPVGSIIAYGGSTAPEGWLLCDGKPIDSRYTDLRSTINSSMAPDLRSRFIVGAGQGTGQESYSLNGIGGESKHTLSIEEMPKHRHELYTAGSKWANEGWIGQNKDVKIKLTDRTDDNDKPGSEVGIGKTDVVVVNEGESQPHNNLPPYYALTYIIKY